MPKADGPARRSRLALCRLSADTLKLGMWLLGISSLERMGGGRGVRGIQAGILPNRCLGLTPDLGTALLMLGMVWL